MLEPKCTHLETKVQNLEKEKIDLQTQHTNLEKENVNLLEQNKELRSKGNSLVKELQKMLKTNETLSKTNQELIKKNAEFYQNYFDHQNAQFQKDSDWLSKAEEYFSDQEEDEGYIPTKKQTKKTEIESFEEEMESAFQDTLKKEKTETKAELQDAVSSEKLLDSLSEYRLHLIKNNLWTASDERKYLNFEIKLKDSKVSNTILAEATKFQKELEVRTH
ncbi:MAG TPA: hypothetical protein PKM32_04835 [Planctomycetota bacterium]|nr:hypothetical protein [Planctomycetota bacterium]